MFLLLEEDDVAVNMDNMEDFYVNGSQMIFNQTNSTDRYVCDFDTYEKAKAEFNSILLKIKSGSLVVILRGYNKH